MMQRKDAIFAREQAGGYAAAKKKLPLWAACDRVVYPSRVPLEQCSSQITAEFKAALVSGESFADLCGGFGVDSFFFAKRFGSGAYVEKDATLFEIAKHNFDVLGCQNVACQCTSAEEYLNSLTHADLIYLDPARRSESGKKVFLLQDCSPDVLQLKDELLSKCDTLMLKLSPLMDIAAAIQVLPQITDVYVVSVKNECKELLLLLQKGHSQDLRLHCCDLPQGEIFSFNPQDEQTVQVEYSAPLKYLYEPAAAVLKAGAFKAVAAAYGLYKLHPSSHLYTADSPVENFPGRSFEVLDSHPVKERLCRDISQANLSVRNFPSSAAQLQKKLKIKDGGDLYLFATTLNDNSHTLLRCKKL